MKNIRLLLSFLLVLCMVMPLSAVTKQKYHPMTKKYKNARLEQVLKDVESKTGYTLKYDREDVDLNKRITAEFKNTSAKNVLKRVLDKDLQTAVKRGVITISKKPAQPEQYTVTATVPSRVEEDSLKKVSVYEDTTYTIACKTVTKEIPSEPQEPTQTSKGHYLQPYLGLGYSQHGYSLQGADDSNSGFLGATLGLNYAYYFHENWGVMVGVAFDYFGDKATLNSMYEWQGQIDTDGEMYDHRVYAHDWTEYQHIGQVAIPVGIQMMYPVNKKEQPTKIYAGLGVQVGLPVLKQYKASSGSIEHRGWYPQWNMEVADQTDRDFYTEQTGDMPTGDKMSLKAVTVGVYADLGVAIPIAQQWDLLLGAFAKVTCNNIYDGSKELGWRNEDAVLPYRQHTFMEDYAGVESTTQAEAVRPWMVGVKIGFNWHHKEKPKEVPPTYERLQVCDTTLALVERRDTVLKPQPVVARQIAKLMETSVIWFDLDKWAPKLDPPDIIDKIAAILLENPEQHILVNGHASKEGNEKHNQMLSDKRAEAVVKLLRAKGVPAEQIHSKGYSSSVEYKTAEGSKHEISLDRRVEIIPINE